MIVRYGFYEGTVLAARRDEFDAHFRDVVIPRLAAMPGVVSVRLLRGLSVGLIAPRFHHAIELTCRDEDALVAAMTSKERRELQRTWCDVMDSFDGATPHANFKVAAIVAGPEAVDGANPSDQAAKHD